MRARIWSAKGMIFGSSAITVASTLTTAYPAARTMTAHSLEQRRAVGIPVGGIGGWEMAADVAEGGGAEEGVGDGVEEHVGVGVPEQTALVRNLDAAQDQSAAGGEAMGVVADAGADHAGLSSVQD